MSEREVPPGGEAKIDVKMNTRNRRGEMVKAIRVTSNDPKQPQAVLKIRAQIDAPPRDQVATPGPAPAVRDRGRLKFPPRKLQRPVKPAPASSSSASR